VAKNDPTRILRRFHAEGKRANLKGAERKAKYKRIKGTLERLGAKTSTAKNRLMEARKFARRCDRKELNFLCGLSQKDWVLTWSHVLQLIRVAVQGDRIELAEDCAANTWSSRRLQREIDLRGLHRSYGGRKQSRPESDEEELLITDRLLCSVIRWSSVVESDASQTGKRGSSQVKKPKRAKRTKTKPLPSSAMREIRERLHDIAKDAYELCEAVRDELQDRRSRSPKRVRPAKSTLRPRTRRKRKK
jgi:hypothetical protein